jgi:two-component system, cell cycle sensor histidine kinase and response regulator CckA
MEHPSQLNSKSPLFSEEVVNLLFEAAEVAICMLDSNYRYVRVNRAYCELVGKNESAVLGQQCYLIQTPDTHLEALNAFHKAFQGDTKPFSREWKLPGPTGQQLDLFTQVRVVRDLEQQDYLVITVTDLRRMHKEQERRLAESRFHLAVQECGLGFWDYNIGTGEVYLSPGWKQMLGYEDQELPNTDETFRSLLHPEDFQPVQRAFWGFTKGNLDKYEITFRLRHRDSSYRWILSRGVALRDENAVASRIVGKHTDVTDLRNAELELLHNKQRLDTILAYATDSVLILDAEGRSISLPQKVKERFGFEPDQLIGKSILDQVHPEDRELIASELATLLHNPGKARRLKARYLTASQKVIWFEVTAINLLENPAIRGILVTGNDITEQLRLQDQLIQAQKMESLGHLAGGIAHDFNNMLSIIVGNVDIVLAQVEPIHRQRLEAVHDAAFRAVALAQQLLGFARKRQLQVRKVDLGQLLQEAKQLIHFAVGSKIRIELEPMPASVLPVRADSLVLQQALVNLAINARDAMSNGGQITLSLKQQHIRQIDFRHPDSREGTFMIIGFEDSGSGILAEVLPQIFEPFFTTKPVGLGTGLGLSMVYGTVRQLGGWIEVESELGRGTRFNIYLPAAVTDMS